MQIESIVPSVPSHFASPLPVAVAHVTAHGKAQTAIVEQTAGGYEAYVSPPTGPAVTGPSVELAESRLYTPSAADPQQSSEVNVEA